ncbi:MAG: hypothetical protein IPI84_07620 [Holophagaceae bacterium]|nr:hypothetical protein [Holophagaceae bacterium]
MRPWFPQHRFMTAVAVLALTSAICGASPQSEQDRRVTPRPQGPVGGRVMPDKPRPVTPSSATSGRDTTRRPSGPRTMEMEPRPGPAPRVTRVSLHPGTRVVVPPAWDRCTSMPTLGYWRGRDLMAEIQWLSRRGFIPVSPIGDSVDLLTDYVQTPAGWRAYGISVPAGGTVQIEVQHPKTAWFRLMLVDKWGTPGPGMLQAAIAHQPVMVTYKNPKDEATAIYVIVDDPAWWSDAKDPYTLAIRRNWDPAQTDLSQVKMVAGLWGASPSVSAEFRGPSLTGPAVYPR